MGRRSNLNGVNQDPVAMRL